MNRLSHILQINKIDLDKCINEVVFKLQIDDNQFVSKTIESFYVKSMLVICSSPNGRDFTDSYNIVSKNIKKYFNRNIGYNIIFVNMFADDKIDETEFKLKYPNDLLLDYVGSTFPWKDNTKNLVVPNKYDIIWFAGCNILDHISDGINELHNYVNLDTIIFFTEGLNYHNKKELNKKEFEAPFMNIKSITVQNLEDKPDNLYNKFQKIINFPFFKFKVNKLSISPSKYNKYIVFDFGYDNTSKVIFDFQKMSIMLTSDRTDAINFSTDLSDTLSELFPKHHGYLKNVPKDKFDFWLNIVKNKSGKNNNWVEITRNEY